VHRFQDVLPDANVLAAFVDKAQGTEVHRRKVAVEALFDLGMHERLQQAVGFGPARRF
jgi:hypothetical protein